LKTFSEQPDTIHLQNFVYLQFSVMCIFGPLLQICFSNFSKILIFFKYILDNRCHAIKKFQQSGGSTEPDHHSSEGSLSRPVCQLSFRGSSTTTSMGAVQKRSMSGCCDVNMLTDLGRIYYLRRLKIIW